MDKKLLEEFDSYFASVEEHCPFLNAAQVRNTVRNCAYWVRGSNSWSAQQRIFSLGVVHAEAVRKERQSATSDAAGLVCHNLILRLRGDCEMKEEDLLGYPHLFLKSLYTRVGLMFGKFWQGELQRSKSSGKWMPIPPVSFLSIRSAHIRLDDRFFESESKLRQDLAGAVDEGQNVLGRFGLQAGRQAPSYREVIRSEAFKILAESYRAL